MSQIKHVQRVNVCEPKIITERDIIKSLHGIVEQRRHAASYYPNSKYYHHNMEVINRVTVDLIEAYSQPNYKCSVKICLRQELPLQYLAPRSTVKIFNSYMQKLNFLMDACRTLLNYQKQA